MAAENGKILAYKGNEPYIFISYSHDNSEQIRPVLEMLSGEYRFWYDEGIRSGEEWVAVIGDKIYNCEMFIVFLSKDALGSRFIDDEIHYAYKYAKKMMAVYLEPVTIGRSMEFMLERFQYIEAFKNADMEITAEQLKDGLPENTRIIESARGENAAKDEITGGLAFTGNELPGAEPDTGQKEEQKDDPQSGLILSEGTQKFEEVYDEGRLLGQGGSAVVLVARSRKTGAEYALKRQFFRTGEKDARVTRAAVRNELQKMLLLNEKPYTPVVVDYFEEPHVSHLVMSRIEGMNLRDLLRVGTRQIDEQTVISLIYQMALILADFHESGLVYGDVKPSNFIINQWGQIFIIDFGGTCSIDDRNYLKIHTPRYAAPEQIDGSAVLPDFRFDVYGLGKVFKELMMRTRYYPGSVPLFDSDQRYANLSPYCERIYNKMTQTSPKNRYRTIGEVTAALETLIDWSTENTLRALANTVENWNIKPDAQGEREQDEDETAGSTARPINDMSFGTMEATAAAFAYGGDRPPFYAGYDVSHILR